MKMFCNSSLEKLCLCMISFSRFPKRVMLNNIFVSLQFCSILQFPVIITRSNNVYGPHQYPEKVHITVTVQFDILFMTHGLIE